MSPFPARLVEISTSSDSSKRSHVATSNLRSTSLARISAGWTLSWIRTWHVAGIGLNERASSARTAMTCVRSSARSLDAGNVLLQIFHATGEGAVLLMPISKARFKDIGIKFAINGQPSIEAVTSKNHSNHHVQPQRSGEKCRPTAIAPCGLHL